MNNKKRLLRIISVLVLLVTIMGFGWSYFTDYKIQQLKAEGGVSLTLEKDKGVASVTQEGYKVSKNGVGWYKKGTNATVKSAVKAGYSLDGWYNGGSKVADTHTHTFVMNEPTVLMAKTKTISYTITGNLDGGTIDGKTTWSKQYTVEESVTLPTPVKKGHTFLGWIEKGGSQVPNKNVVIPVGTTGNKTYTAKWSVNNYYADINGILDGDRRLSTDDMGMFDVYLNGEVYRKDARDISGGLPYGSVIEIKNIRTDEGRTYLGVESDLSLRFTIDVGNNVRNLRFKTNEYTLRYNVNGGVGTIPDVKFKHGTSVTTAGSGFTRDFYTLAKWNTVAGGTGTDVALGGKYSGYSGKDGDIVNLYAQWNPNRVNIKYHSNGGTLGSKTGSAYTMDLNGYILADGKLTYDYATYNGKFYNVTGTSDLHNAHLGGFIFLEKTGYHIVAKQDWNTNSLGTGKVFGGDDATYKGEDFADLKDGDATVTLYANWKPNSYTVRYNANGGLGTMSDSSHVYDTAKTLSDNRFARAGYTFRCWTTNADGTGKSYNNLESVKNLTATLNGTVDLYAQWDKVGYNISYNLNGGSVTGNPTSYDVTTQDFTLRNPTKTGYTFTGWTGSNGTTPQTTVVIRRGTTGNLSYTANWKATDYTLSFDANGGTCTEKSRSVAYGSRYGTLPTPTRIGYSFKGWYTTSVGSTRVTENNVMGAGDVTIYAQWTPNSYIYNVVYKSSSGVSLGTSTVQGLFGTTVQVNPPSKTGYIAPSSQSVVFDSTTAKTLTFTYSPISYKITYTLNGGTEYYNPTTYTIETPTFTLYQPSRSGYRFVGWTGSNGGYAQTYVTISKGTTGNLSYSANWETSSTTVSFDAMGGSSSFNKTYNVGDVLGQLPTPTKTGYNFDGWYTSAYGGTKVNSQTVVTEGMQLFAHWTPITYTVRYYPNGASGSYVTQTCNYGEYYTVKNNPFSYSGHRFVKWTRNQNGAGTSYNEGDQFINLITTQGGVVDLYAQWESTVQAFAVFSSTDNSLNFYKRDNMPSVGSYFDGRYVSNVYTGVENTVNNRIPWSDKRSSLQTVRFVDTIQPINISYWFSNASNLTSVIISSIDTSRCTKMESMFLNCRNLSSLDLTKLKATSATKNINNMFALCGLTSFDGRYWNTENVEYAVGMFSGTQITNLDLSYFDFRNCIDMNNIFNSNVLKSIKLPRYLSYNTAHWDCTQKTFYCVEENYAEYPAGQLPMDGSSKSYTMIDSKPVSKGKITVRPNITPSSFFYTVNIYDGNTLMDETTYRTGQTLEFDIGTHIRIVANVGSEPGYDYYFDGLTDNAPYLEPGFDVWISQDRKLWYIDGIVSGSGTLNLVIGKATLSSKETITITDDSRNPHATYTVKINGESTNTQYSSGDSFECNKGDTIEVTSVCDGFYNRQDDYDISNSDGDTLSSVSFTKESWNVSKLSGTVERTGYITYI